MNCGQLDCQNTICTTDSLCRFVINDITGDFLYDYGFKNEVGESSLGCFERVICNDCVDEWEIDCVGICELCKRFMGNYWIDYKKKRYCQFCIPSIQFTSAEMDRLTKDIQEKGNIVSEFRGVKKWWATKSVFKVTSDRSIIRTALERTLLAAKESQ